MKLERVSMRPTHVLLEGTMNPQRHDPFGDRLVAFADTSIQVYM
jgi:hypothetical protein